MHIDSCQARASSEEDESSSSDDEASPGEDYGKSDSKDKKTGGGYLKISISTSKQRYNVLQHLTSCGCGSKWKT